MKIDPKTRKIVDMALEEDAASGDITSRLLINRHKWITARILAKQTGIVCGVFVAQYVFRKVSPRARVTIHVSDGQKVRRGQAIMTVKGHAGKLLAGERTVVNFLQRLSGIATLTRRYADKVRGTKTQIFDTRKTTPALRILEKYAVRCGGAQNHRMSLAAMAMIKDNHLKLMDDRDHLMAFRDILPKDRLLEIEADNLRQVRDALDARADIVLLDNMNVARLKKAVRLIRSRSRTVQMEASGSVRFKDLRRIAALGIERISIGALTHSAPALDISMEFLAR